MRRLLAALLALVLVFCGVPSAQAGCDQTGTETFNVVIPQFLTTAINGGTGTMTIWVHNPITSGINMTASFNYNNNASSQAVCNTLVPWEFDNSHTCTGQVLTPGDTIQVPIVAGDYGNVLGTMVIVVSIASGSIGPVVRVEETVTVSGTPTWLNMYLAEEQRCQ
jgi:hypothetical protein